MTSATIFEAKTNLSDLVRRAQAGEEVIITSGRDKKPVVRLQPIDPPPLPQRLGIMYDPNFRIPDAVWEPLPTRSVASSSTPAIHFFSRIRIQSDALVGHAHAIVGVVTP